MRSQLATERVDREEIEVQLADLKQKSLPASDLSDKAAKVLSYIKTLLPAKTRLPSDAMPKLEKILGKIEG